MATHDRVAIVTGSASGIGRALAEQLARQQRIVVLVDIDGERVQEVASSLLRSSGARVEAHELDVTDADAVEQMIRTTRDTYGRIDYLFNNAGIAIAGEARDLSLDDWRRTIDVDLNGVVNGVVAAYPIMIEQGYGHIVNTASLAGLTPAPGLVPYAAAKHGVVGLSVSLRAEASRYGVGVHAVCPGVIDTPLKRNIVFRNVEMEESLSNLPLQSYPAERCARVILRGVERDLPVIVVTGHAHVIHWFHRLQPRLYNRLVGMGVGRILNKLRN